MIDITLDVFIEEDIDQAVLDAINSAVKTGLGMHECDGSELSVSIVDENEIQELNREARRMDRPTDVLSFPFIDYQAGQTIEKARDNDHMKNPDTGLVMLGDIIICYPIARTQAKEYGHSVKREMAFLAVHGLLHLLGYDHVDAGEEAEMQRMQESILSKCEIFRQ